MTHLRKTSGSVSLEGLSILLTVSVTGMAAFAVWGDAASAAIRGDTTGQSSRALVSTTAQAGLEDFARIVQRLEPVATPSMDDLLDMRRTLQEAEVDPNISDARRTAVRTELRLLEEEMEARSGAPGRHRYRARYSSLRNVDSRATVERALANANEGAGTATLLHELGQHGFRLSSSTTGFIDPSVRFAVTNGVMQAPSGVRGLPNLDGLSHVLGGLLNNMDRVRDLLRERIRLEVTTPGAANVAEEIHTGRLGDAPLPRFGFDRRARVLRITSDAFDPSGDSEAFKAAMDTALYRSNASTVINRVKHRKFMTSAFGAEDAGPRLSATLQGYKDSGYEPVMVHADNANAWKLRITSNKVEYAMPEHGEADAMERTLYRLLEDRDALDAHTAGNGVIEISKLDD